MPAVEGAPAEVKPREVIHDVVSEQFEKVARAALEEATVRCFEQFSWFQADIHRRRPPNGVGAQLRRGR